MKKILNYLMWYYIIILLGTLFITLINYFNLMNNNVISIIKFILPLIAITINSYKLGKTSNKQGYLEGLKFGIIISLISIIIILILDKFIIKSLLYYGILILTSIMGSTIGINRKKLTN